MKWQITLNLYLSKSTTRSITNLTGHKARRDGQQQKIITSWRRQNWRNGNVDQTDNQPPTSILPKHKAAVDVKEKCTGKSRYCDDEMFFIIYNSEENQQKGQLMVCDYHHSQTRQH